ncbi:MAG: glycosyl hydrolase 115 family protein [Paludibacter sp.]|nr:glycosyl hydrolase 115 family protein [Paludibacter sp.]
MRHTIHSLFFSLSFLFLSLATYAEPITITELAGQGSFPLVASGKSATLVVDSSDAEVVTIAATALSGDIKLITGIQPVVANQIGNGLPVIIGTLGKSKLIDSLATTGKISTANIVGKWETFSLSVVSNPFPGVDNALVIFGSDPRGTAYGVFELSRLMGVSPMVWWADVTPKSRSSIYITAGESIVGPPTVQYRGIFINDEDWGLQPWAAKTFDPVGDIGPKTYEKVFEMLLRVKANYIWPAMHPSTHSFNYFADNKVVAGRYSIVMGSSHHEPLLYNTLKDWPYASSAWNPFTNLPTIMTELEKRVISNGKYENLYTLCMRGAGDGPMPGTLNEQTTKLQECIGLERGLLAKYINPDTTKVPQVFFPYKEVLLQYNNGLKVPDDVTLGWVDDNFGYIRQLSNPTEQLRSGGSGVYYHFSYWGVPDDYLWLSSNSPSLCSSEMSKAYALNAKKLWIFNVGDIKPQEMELQFAMDFAWDVNAWTPEKSHLYSTQWAAETFGAEFGESIGQIKQEYYRLAASGKPEHLVSISYTYQEINQRIADYERLVTAAKAVQAQIPARLQDAYFQLIEYPVEAAANMNVKILCARQSLAYAGQGKPEALDLSAKAISAYENIVNLTKKYNTEIAGGKWNGIMDYAPRGLARFYDPTVATKVNTDALPAASVDSVKVIPAANYTTKNEAAYTISNVEGLGVEKSALSVWPLNMTTYTAANVTSAPYVEYDVPVAKGTNSITVRCLPTFPLYTTLTLRYAVSVDGSAPVFVNIANAAETTAWSNNLRNGYVFGESKYQSTTAKTIKVRVYFTDPGVVLSALTVSGIYVNALTEQLVNPNFEYKSAGVLNDGTTVRGIPYGWSSTGTLLGNSYGINSDGSNYSGSNLCWMNSTPMPAKFELYQTVKNLPAGEYIVRCRLAAFTGLLTNVRLFANNYVQYFGNQTDYVSNLTTGETNTFAGYTASSTALLQEMAVKVPIFKGDSLKLGVRSSNITSNGTAATTNAGWFKVDHFRLECVKLYSDATAEKSRLDSLITVAKNLYTTTKEGTGNGDYFAASRQTFDAAIQTASGVNLNSNATLPQVVTAIADLETAIAAYRKSVITFTTSFIVNPDFEYKSAGVLNDRTTVRGIPYGWEINGTLIGNSYGINNDGANYSGNNLCWINSTPMPSKFELFQTIGGLPAGDYTLRCRMAAFGGLLGNARLFANNNVQYFGNESDYIWNQTTGETNTFAGWTATSASFLKEMSVNITINAGDSLKLGIRSSSMKSDGTAAIADNTGWFKVDNFRLEQRQTQTAVNNVEDFEVKIFVLDKGICVSINNFPAKGNITLYSILGVQILNTSITSNKTYIQPPSHGIFIAKVMVNTKITTSKIVF